MDLRELRGLEIAARLKLVWRDGVCIVPSQSGNGSYKVKRTPDGFTCECEDHELTRKPCKHIIGAKLVLEREGGDKAPDLDTNIIPIKKTYPQAWGAYNLAQTTEKHRFQVLLFELCKGLKTPRPKQTGRLPVPIQDAIFSIAFKVYSTVSSRRFTCDLNDAHAKGYLTAPVHYNRVCAFLENPAYTPVLHALIVQSSLPLRAIETVFAPDSTGFSAGRFVRWFDEKYGCNRSKHDYVKAHLICGVKTNIVTAVEILDKHANDCPQLPALVNKTAENFTVKEVPADKGYLSRENLELVAGLGAMPHVPFKSNSIQGEAGSLWEKLWLYYQLHRDEFLPHYHQRSNAESTFSAIKRKFGDYVRSKTDTAMVNEVLCKILCHNLCVVIQEQCELGIEAAFWTESAAEQAHPANLVRLNQQGRMGTEGIS